MMTRPANRRRGVTLVEMAVAMLIGAIILMTAWVTWEISWRQTVAASNAGACQRNAFSALRRIEQEVMRAEVIQVPDPDHPSVPSMQLRIPNGAGTLRRAFRLQEGALIVDLKDEGVDPYEAFDGLSALSFTLLDAPANSQVRVTCDAAQHGQAVQMQTVATRRN
jgi:prepilin-type N-terminal cleavage/methylation domain-containing protein